MDIVSISQFKRTRIINEHYGFCAYCGFFIGKEGTIDHYLPIILGGTDDSKNLRWCCLNCNVLKRGLHPDKWEKDKAKIYKHHYKYYEKRNY